MKIGPWEIGRASRSGHAEATKTSGLDLVTRLPTPHNNWLGSVGEMFAGAWQRNITASVPDVMSHSTAWACIVLIATTIAKLRIKLIAENDGVWDEITNSAYTPVLRKPNHYQNRIQFLKSWVLSKLLHGNTYILKERDNRGVVSALYVLDPKLVQVLQAPDGSVYYALGQDFLSGIVDASKTVPASEIIHDIHIPMYHPLVGVSPIHASGRSILHSLAIQAQSEKLFENGSQPGGVLTAPGVISTETAERIQAHWQMNFAGRNNVGKIAVLGDGLKYDPMAMTAVDAQLIDQLKWDDEKVCSTFQVPGFMVGVGPMPPYNSVEALWQQFHALGLQELIESIELCLDEGLTLADNIGVELDLDGLIRMDSTAKMDAAVKGVGAAIYTPNEARQMFNKAKKIGGDSLYLQQQDFSIEALHRRDTANPAPSSNAPSAPQPAAASVDATAKAIVVALSEYREATIRQVESTKSFDYAGLRTSVMRKIAA